MGLFLRSKTISVAKGDGALRTQPFANRLQMMSRCFMHYKFVRISQTQRVTQAMAADVT